jgi:hypothetical protein
VGRTEESPSCRPAGKFELMQGAVAPGVADMLVR